LTQYTKTGKNIPNEGKIHQTDLKAPKMAIKYTQIFHSKAYKINQTCDFWSENKPSGNPAK
jgi:starvation-inducible outer membrane lipoprotein